MTKIMKTINKLKRKLIFRFPDFFQIYNSMKNRKYHYKKSGYLIYSSLRNHFSFLKKY